MAKRGFMAKWLVNKSTVLPDAVPKPADVVLNSVESLPAIVAPISASCDDSEDTTDHLGSPLPIHGSMISEDDEDDDVVISSASKRRRIVPKIDDDSALELSSDEDTLPEKTIELTLPEKIEKAVQTRFGMKRWCNFGDRLLERTSCSTADCHFSCA